MSINEKLVRIQNGLKAPKSQFNKFGNYAYRSCEDIVEAVKPLLAKEGLTLTLRDDVVLVGDRIYIRAIAVLSDGENTIQTSAFAREPKELKGMVESQVTGATSSYARKYALNGLFAIDDTKDADSQEYGEVKKNIDKNIEALKKKLTDLGVNIEDVAKYFKVSVDELTEAQLQNIVDRKSNKGATK